MCTCFSFTDEREREKKTLSYTKMAKAIDKGYLTLNPIKVEIPSAALFFFLPETLLLLSKSGEMINYNVSSEKNASTEVRRKVHFFSGSFLFLRCS